MGIVVPALFGASLFSMLWFSRPGLMLAGGIGLLVYSSSHKDGWYYLGMFLTMIVALEIARVVWGKEKGDPKTVPALQSPEEPRGVEHGENASGERAEGDAEDRAP